ncbi:hypothetical protein DYB34_011332 [Aphanomyces astaci]|uniref:Serine aminopeptidase S33 domain-containing protein n=1 Tax=Aphanomyces astaci TaxID=112090 RepID=A0A418BC64_APHAT|nr:hypothetical protein DYB34_011332 [Aphanomyces astaci]
MDSRQVSHKRTQDMREFCHAATSSGYRAVVFNKRGHGQSKLTTPRLQAFGCTSDMKAVLAHVQSTFPGVPVVGTTCPFNFNDDEAASRVGVGYSAGAGLLSSYLGEMGQHSKLAAGVLVSPAVYVKLHAFESLAEYWKASDPLRDVHKIAVPTLFLSAKDDPVCPTRTFAAMREMTT